MVCACVHVYGTVEARDQCQVRSSLALPLVFPTFLFKVCICTCASVWVWGMYMQVWMGMGAEEGIGCPGVGVIVCLELPILDAGS